MRGGKPYFPMFVDISEKQIVVVGGGKVAERRVETLLKFAGDITVVAPQVTGQIQKRAQEGSVRWIEGAVCGSGSRMADAGTGGAQAEGNRQPGQKSGAQLEGIQIADAGTGDAKSEGIWQPGQKSGAQSEESRIADAGTGGWKCQPDMERILRGADMVLAATNDSGCNEEIRRFCRERGILVNVSHNKELCDFYFPAVVVKDQVTVGITSGGVSHRQAKEVRERIEQSLLGL